MGEATKTCTKCKRELPATTEFFHRSRSFKDGLKYKCKECRSEEGIARSAIGRVIPEDLPGEEWRPTVEFPEWYGISNLGRVRRSHPGIHTFDGKIVKPSINPGGYEIIGLSMGDGRIYRSVHSLVATAFIGPYPDEKEINHIDGNKTSNNADNLEYVTRSENQLHAYDMGLSTPLRGESHNMAKLSEKYVLEIIDLLDEGELTQTEIAEMYGVVPASISNINCGKTWQDLTNE